MRLSLGVKLTLTSTLLVALIVAFMGYILADTIRREHDERAAATAAQYRAQLDALASNSAGLLASAVSEHLIGTELAPLDLVVHQIVRQDPHIVSVQIANKSRHILANSAAPIVPSALALLSPLTDREATLNGRPVLLVEQPITDPATPDAPPIGFVAFTYELSSLDDQRAAIEVERKRQVSESLRFTLLVGLIVLASGALLSLVQGLRYARPIRRLAQTSARIAQGDLAARVSIQHNDEIGDLGRQFNHMADQVQQLLHQAVAKAELDRELALARDIQSVLVPAPGLHHAPGLAVAGYYEPASNVGGDFWDLAILPRGRAALLIGDVTGHGVPAAILTATAKGALDTLRHVHGGDMQVAETMRVLDRVIHEAGHGVFFMTATAIILDAADNALYFSAAAHPPGLLLRWSESGLKVSRLAARGNRLGDGDPSGFEAKRLRVVPGDLLIWYTDGLIDAVDPTGAAYSMRALLQSLGELRADTTPEQAVAKLSQSLTRFRSGAPLNDDVTFVVAKVTL